MPPRISLAAALRHPVSFFRSQTAQVSTSRPLQALRDDVPTPGSSTPTTTSKPTSTTSAILGIERPSSPPFLSPYSSRTSTSTPTDPTNAVSGLFDQMRARALRPQSSGGGGYDRDGNQQQYQQEGGVKRRAEEELQEKWSQDDYARQMTRRWRPGDVYAPHDLSPSEMGKWRRNRARQQDLVDLLGLKPLDMYRNFSVISEFMTTHGRIKRSADTGLRPVNQRKMAKAIRRAIGLGLHPSVHHHPEILARDPVRRLTQNQPTVYNHKF